jgi:biotin carboxylase
MPGRTEKTGLPVLAIPYAGPSLPVMTAAQAAAGMCSILWLADGMHPQVQAVRRALERLGQVVDLGDTDPDEWADVVRPWRPDGMVAFSDHRMVEFARVAEALGLLFHRPEVAARLTDKSAQRAAFRRAGLPVPGTTLVGTELNEAAIKELAKTAHYPAVLKPVHGMDSQTTICVDDADALIGALRTMFGGTRPDMVLEEYLADRAPCAGEDFANYLSVESMVSRRGIEHIAITGRFPPAPPFRETGFFIPADISPGQKSSVLEIASAAVSALGVETGCLHTEIKFTPDGPRIIEVNGRLGGGVPLLLELAGAGSAPRMAMEVALGRDPAPTPVSAADGVAFRLLFQAPMHASEVLAIDGLEQIGNLPGEPTATLQMPPGSELDWRRGSSDYVYSVSGVARSYDQLREIRQRSEATVTVRYEYARA